ncbi:MULTISPECIES: selenium metabolism-associated LysR family transcriptional regulator [unclassified Pseudodesulfovibrio]|uniref:selenium metabolism-associated LysR family transcriptional regulator n=1 Tax=unclassified Pseudodesulfovibrio TaxID=2661612 RepID=UPI000FEB7165|nr:MULTISPECIES: selenium metabolism-associated LysR family transcriptional regulator [unclassified Pseudodesulfovibrio]MCJ2163082.1 selenium metabolism-associated LysR family transcriptional regulator [Pseudodesulfovibrio sp. S3-i]RWU07075.1 LysR family transcriptional regulator [Pseudodesulfovibrio sp. S3]
MDIRKLEAFCKVFELQSFSKAGEAMFLSQPTISSHVANLEDELGVRLFDRLGRKVLPTQAGEVLYKSMVTIFRNLEQAKASIEMLRDRVVGELQIGCSTIPSHSILPALLADFSTRYPDVSFTVHTADSAEVIKRVACGDWPVGIVGKKPEEDELVSKLLVKDKTIVVAAPDASWLPVGDDPIELDKLIQLPWVMRIKGSATRLVLERELALAGHSLQSLNIRCRVEGTCESLAHAANKVGVCFTSRLAAQPLLSSGEVKQLNVPALEGDRQFYLIHHGGRYMFPALKAFIGFHQ